LEEVENLKSDAIREI
jgi:hypothetical protein